MKNLSILVFFLIRSGSAIAVEPIRVLELKGSASETVGKSTYQISVGSLLHAKSQIKVGADSMLIMRLGKDVVTKLAPNTNVSVYALNKKDWELNLHKGITASAIKNPEKRPNHFQVRNRTVVMGVRGTVFYTENLENKPAFLCTCKGTVIVEDEKGKHLDSVTATHHDRPISLEEMPNNAGITIKTAPMGNSHTDADVAYLENLLNKKN